MKETILIIDDEPEILENLETILSDEGHEVVKASSGNEAVENFKAGSFGLVITDMKMPGISGLEVLQRVKQIDKDVEVIILTGYGTMENAIQALRNEGAYDYLGKPLEDIEKLLVTVENALERRRIYLVNDRLLGELRESEERYQMLTNNSQTGIYIHVGGLMKFVNNRFAETLGYTTEEIVGRQYWEFVHPEDREMVKKISLDRARGEWAPVEYEFRHLSMDGEIVWVHNFPTIVQFQGQIANMGNLTYINDRKKVEEQRDKLIAELQKALSEVKTLKGFLPICMHCKQIRNDDGYWKQLEEYIETHSEAQFSHSICDLCIEKHYPEYLDDEDL